MRLTGAFVSRFLEEARHSYDMMAVNSEGTPLSYGEEHRAVERLLDALKYELTAVLVPEVIPHATFSSEHPHYDCYECDLD